MGSIKKYFKREFKLSMFNLEHEEISDFYLSAFQKSSSPLPLLCIRTFLFLGCVAILLTSIIMTTQSMTFGHWLIYLTHWGVIMITATTGMAALVSLKAYFEIQIDSSLGILLVKIYWVFYNITVPVALLITVFYWSFLSGFDHDLDPVLDVFIHAVNSGVMLVLVLFSRVPTRLVHFIHPLLFSITYLIFSIIYYYAGGLSPAGDVFIYPMLDWSQPSYTMITIMGTFIFLEVAHILVALLYLGRNKVDKLFSKNTSSMDI